MSDKGVPLAAAIDDSTEALYRIVAEIPDPVLKARAVMNAVDLVESRLLPDLVSIRWAAIREARQLMSAEELADRLGISRSQVYAALAGTDHMTGPLTIHFRTAAGGVGEVPVAWTVEPVRGTRKVKVTRDEIRRRQRMVTTVVPAESVEVESTLTDSRLDGAFKSLENAAAYALSQADMAADDAADADPPHAAPAGAAWHFEANGESSPRWPRTRYVAVRSWWGMQDHRPRGLR